MKSALYSRDILRLAASIPHHRRLVQPEGSATMNSPICGSEVIVDVVVDGHGKISKIGQEVRACALGQASAALMAAHAIGRSAEELETAGEALMSFLAGTRDDPGEWPGLEVFRPARAHSARHRSIGLAFEAASHAVRIAVARLPGPGGLDRPGESSGEA